MIHPAFSVSTNSFRTEYRTKRFSVVEACINGIERITAYDDIQDGGISPYFSKGFSITGLIQVGDNVIIAIHENENPAHHKFLTIKHISTPSPLGRRILDVIEPEGLEGVKDIPWLPTIVTEVCDTSLKHKFYISYDPDGKGVQKYLLNI